MLNIIILNIILNIVIINIILNIIIINIILNIIVLNIILNIIFNIIQAQVTHRFYEALHGLTIEGMTKADIESLPGK